jgi:SAM-dependent methyltransferase
LKVKAKYRNLITRGDYRQYVGPRRAWRSKGALQFMLCTSLGIQPHHDFLDIGCGSLRAGRWFIPYLNRGKYHGLEPMVEAVDLGLEQEVGRRFAETKRPVFWHNDTFSLDGSFSRQFDMMLCHAVMIHIAKPDLERLFDMVRKYLKPKGLFIGNYQVGKDDFKKQVATYPEIARYRKSTIRLLLMQRDLGYTELPLKDYNHRCRWFVTGRELTDSEMMLVRNVNQVWASMRKKGL